ncbi:MAG: sensor histidine kinase [Deltaproteobacteria bacterium]|nr:sensor histidine kinase [Deltaproteobacteria bacterium]
MLTDLRQRAGPQKLTDDLGRALGTLPMFVIRIDRDENIARSRGAGLRCLGYDSERMAGTPYYHWFPYLKGALDDAAERTDGSWPEVITHKDGRWEFRHWVTRANDGSDEFIHVAVGSPAQRFDVQIVAASGKTNGHNGHNGHNGRTNGNGHAGKSNGGRPSPDGGNGHGRDNGRRPVAVSPGITRGNGHGNGNGAGGGYGNDHGGNGESMDSSSTAQGVRFNDEMLDRIVRAQDAERRRIARELHDETGQWITSILLGLRSLAGRLDDARSRRHAEDLVSQAQNLMESVGGLVKGLHPTMLSEYGFAAAARYHVAEFLRPHDIQSRVEILGTMAGERLNAAIEITMFRVLQEALTNIVKHAGASFVSIVVNMNEDGVHMVIEDDGEGFKADKVGDQNGETGYGIEFMKERVALLGGSFEIETAPGQGTTLFIQIPTAGEVNHD